MSDKKQTAVEWLYHQLINNETGKLTSKNKYEIYLKAKFMEKEQNAEAYKKGWDEGTDALYKEVRKIYDANRIFYNTDS